MLVAIALQSFEQCFVLPFEFVGNLFRVGENWRL